MIRKIVISKERKKEEKEERRVQRHFILWSGVRRQRALGMSDFGVAGV